jgi:hypothetical protein
MPSCPPSNFPPRPLLFLPKETDVKEVKMLDLQGQYLPIRNEIRRAIDEVCDTQALILGPHVERFERNLAEYTGARHAIGVSSGTDAILCSLMAVGVKAGDGRSSMPPPSTGCARRSRQSAASANGAQGSSAARARSNAAGVRKGDSTGDGRTGGVARRGGCSAGPLATAWHAGVRGRRRGGL